MSNPAQEEADRLFSDKTHNTSHPEDRQGDDDLEDDEEKLHTRSTIRSAGVKQAREDDDSDGDGSERDASENYSSFAGTKPTYKVPTTVQYANTGPKGVIADAQSYHRSRREAGRAGSKTASKNISAVSMSNNISQKPSKRDSGSDEDNSVDEEDDEFMQAWRQKRLEELRGQSAADTAQRRVSPSRRVYGRLDTVDASSYLDAVEKCPAESIVVVLIYDPVDPQSDEVSEELERLAYKWTHVRFVKLDHEIAEMEELEIPAILAYRAGDVFATVSGAKSEGLEDVLKRHGVLMR